MAQKSQDLPSPSPSHNFPKVPLLCMKMRHSFLVLFLIIFLTSVFGFLIFKESLLEIINSLNRYSQKWSHMNPLFLILGITLLPLVAMPISALYIIGAAVYGVTLGLVYGGIGAALNIGLAYWIARTALRKSILRWVTRRGHSPPTIPAEEYNYTIILVRIMPGTPLFLQNYLLALAGIPFLRYWMLSWIFQMFYVAVFVITGGALFESRFGLAFIGICGIIALMIIIHFMRRYYEKKNAQ